jgi:hypothetical protein
MAALQGAERFGANPTIVPIHTSKPPTTVPGMNQSTRAQKFGWLNHRNPQAKTILRQLRESVLKTWLLSAFAGQKPTISVWAPLKGAGVHGIGSHGQ